MYLDLRDVYLVVEVGTYPYFYGHKAHYASMVLSINIYRTCYVNLRELFYNSLRGFWHTSVVYVHFPKEINVQFRYD